MRTPYGLPVRKAGDLWVPDRDSELWVPEAPYVITPRRVPRNPFGGTQIGWPVPKRQAAITFTTVQEDEAQGDPASVSLASTATAGNLLIGEAAERGGTSYSSLTGFTDFTELEGHDNELANSSARVSAGLYFKVAVGGEQNFSIDNGTSNTKWAFVIELSPSTAISTCVKSGGNSAGTGTGSTSPLGTGSTASLATGDYLLVVMAASRQEGNLPSYTWTETQDDELIYFPDAAGSCSIRWGFRDVGGGTTYSDTVAWTGSGHETVAMIGALGINLGGGGGSSTVVPQIMMSHRRRRAA